MGVTVEGSEKGACLESRVPLGNSRMEDEDRKGGARLLVASVPRGAVWVFGVPTICRDPQQKFL